MDSASEPGEGPLFLGAFTSLRIALDPTLTRVQPSAGLGLESAQPSQGKFNGKDGTMKMGVVEKVGADRFRYRC